MSLNMASSEVREMGSGPKGGGLSLGTCCTSSENICRGNLAEPGKKGEKGRGDKRECDDEGGREGVCSLTMLNSIDLVNEPLVGELGGERGHKVNSAVQQNQCVYQGSH